MAKTYKAWVEFQESSFAEAAELLARDGYTIRSLTEVED